MGTLTTTDNTALTTATISTTTKRFVASATAESTRRAYRSDARIFIEWCESKNLQSLPASPETVSNFIADQASNAVKPATLARRLAAIRSLHESAELPTPTSNKLVSATMKGIKREMGTAPKQKNALTIELLYKVLAAIDTATLQGKRDRAILLLGFSGAFRRSELAALEVSDIEFVEHGLKVLVRSSKTDKFGEGETVGIYSQRLNIPSAVREYMDSGSITEGALFRPITKGGNLRFQAISDKSIAEVVKRYVKAAGLNPDAFGGHSLRSGFVTTALESGAGMFRVMDVTRHKSTQTLKGYARAADMFRNHAGSSFL